MANFLAALASKLGYAPIEKATGNLVPVNSSGAWFPVIRESFTGAWQKNVTVDYATVLAYHAVYACVTLIAGDIAKNRVKLVAQDENGIWSETTNPAYSPVLRKPNHYMTRVRFWEAWMLSKLLRGNTYVLKARDNRNVVTGLYILNPNRVKPLLADDGSIFYELQVDEIAGVAVAERIPARDIIHDRFNCLDRYNLIGTSPIYACGLAATQGLSIQLNSARFFKNNGQPSGLLTAPGRIDQANAERLKALWEEKYSGENYGAIAVMGDGLSYAPLAMTAEDAQLIEQLKWTAEVVCSCFHVPAYKIGVGPQPLNNNVQSLNTEYFSQCLQVLIEDAEEALDAGLGIGWGTGLGTEFDVENLLRMDTLTQIQALKEGIGAAIFTPNEARKKFDLVPKEGGDDPYLQQQNYSLPALAKRDAKDDPFGSAKPPPPAGPAPDGTPPPEPPPPAKDGPNVATRRELRDRILRSARQHELARTEPV